MADGMARIVQGYSIAQASLAAPIVLCCPCAALSDAIHTEAAMPTNGRIKADVYVVPSNETVVIQVQFVMPPAAPAAVAAAAVV
jgi:hypothetical protein